MPPPHACNDPFGAQHRNFRFRRRRISSSTACAIILVCFLFGAKWLCSSTPSEASHTHRQAKHTKVVANSPVRADIVFVMDATGSMADEIQDVKQGIMTIGNQLANRKPQPAIRFGAVFYRDVSDAEMVKAVPLSEDLPSVRGAIMDVEATGGGDWPEHVGIGLHKALEMDWSHSNDNGTRLVYLVGDAPPQSYNDGYDVPTALSLAKEMGVKVHVIGCSGLNDGTPAMKNIAEATGGSFSQFERQKGSQQHSATDVRRRRTTIRPVTDSRRRRTISGSTHEARARSPYVFRWNDTAPASDAPLWNALRKRTATTAMTVTNPAADRAGSGVALAEKETGEREIDGPVIGIDLGSSTSAVAIYKNGRVEIIPNENGDRTTPSHILFDETGILVGAAAAAYTNASHTAFGFKRLMGMRYSNETIQEENPRTPFSIVDQAGNPVIAIGAGSNRRQFSPQELSAMILAQMRMHAENYIGKEVSHAVITVPASFSDSQREATKDAGTLAGLKVLRIINEPTAAAIAYGLDKRSEENILVYDLGGESLHVSLLTIGNGVFDILATAGNSHLGGRDFDDRVVDHFVYGIQNFHHVDDKGEISGNARCMRKLRRAAVEAKHALSSLHQTRVEVEDLSPGFNFNMTLTRARFDKDNRDLFQLALRPIEQVLQESGIDADQIHEVLLIGGSARIPRIHELVKAFFKGKEPIRGLNPDEVVAYGAATQAGVLSGEGGHDLLLLDVTPLTLGIASAESEMVPIIPRNSVIPNRKAHVLSTSQESQHTLHIQVYEGEHSSAKHNHLLGQFNLSGIPAAASGVPQVEVVFQVDSNGILSVSAEDKGTGNSENIIISNEEGRLTEEQIELMIEGKAYDAIMEDAAKSDVNVEELDDDELGDRRMGRLSKMMLASISDEL